MSIELRVITNAIPSLIGRLQGTVQKALDVGVVTCLEVANPLTPVDTGMLRKNKTVAKGGNTRTITWNQHYAAYVEFGTKKMAAQPFAKPGMDAALPAVAKALEAFGRG